MSTKPHDSILILDFGSQYAQLIARRVRELKVFCRLVRHDLTAARIKELAPTGIILSGGPASVYEKGAPKCDPAIFELGIPILGICYGMQLACQILGAKVVSAPHREFGRAELTIEHSTGLFDGVTKQSTVWMSHGDQVQAAPEEWEVLGSTATCPMAAAKHRHRKVYTLQFHPEVVHTEFGRNLLGNFLFGVCNAPANWDMGDFVRQVSGGIRDRVGTDKVICGLSGGVDSSVCAALLAKAIGSQTVCIFVDNGLLRSGEAEEVERVFRAHSNADFRMVDASKRFLDALKGVEDPQVKRKLIGHVFIDAFRDAAKGIANAKFLAQGTLYPDVIESGGATDGPAATIKTHHNVGGLPEELGFELIEPLRDLFKDEVRRLGEVLQLPDEVVWRHPFPGPGLAVRCLGEVTEERLEILRKADVIFLEELRAAGLYRQTSQAFAVLLPVRTVGVMGDDRTYDQVIALRCVQTDDFMTADWSRLPHELLAKVSTRIINEVRGVNRVTYDISSKPPATIEWE
ncbi:MAG: glutamine-hydrolyzing GMP synthase [Planctomycetota bacterium]|nr:glutamine-hydrolyzing GMP synthase [Planctomycetota bacterium]